MEIHKIHVSVHKNRDKIEKLCKVAILEKKFEALGWFTALNEKEFRKILREHFFNNCVYILVFDKKNKDIDTRRLSKLKDNMEEGEVRMGFKKAIEWLKEI